MIQKSFRKNKNCLDVQPPDEFIEKLIQFYNFENITLLKKILRMRGAANKLFHLSNRDEALFRFGEEGRDLNDLVRE